MERYKSHTAFLIIATLFLGLTYLFLLANERTLDAFAREDGIFENLTAVYLLGASLVFVVCFFRFRKSSRLLKLSYIGLALLFFVGAGEEISWGERIFKWEDQNYIRDINVQGELTIHNLKYFQGEEAIIPVSISQLFIVFAFVFAVLIPLACRLFPKIERFLAPIIPIMPLEFGVLVVATYIFQKSMLRILPMFPALYQHPSMPIPQGVHEIREHGYTFALLVSSIFYFSREKNVKMAAKRRESQGDVVSPGLSASLQAENKGDKT